MWPDGITALATMCRLSTADSTACCDLTPDNDWAQKTTFQELQPSHDIASALCLFNRRRLRRAKKHGEPNGRKLVHVRMLSWQLSDAVPPLIPVFDDCTKPGRLATPTSTHQNSLSIKPIMSAGSSNPTFTHAITDDPPATAM